MKQIFYTYTLLALSVFLIWIALPLSVQGYWQGGYYGQATYYSQPYYQGYYQSAYAAGANWYVGARSLTTPERFLAGSVDEIRVYNRALSAGEITSLYSGTAPTAGLVGWWPLQGLLSSIAEGFFGWTQLIANVTPPCAQMCTGATTLQDPWCRVTTCPVICANNQCVDAVPEGCLSTSASTCQSTGLVRVNTSTTLYWDIQNAVACTVTGTNGDYWESVAEPAGVTTSAITQHTTYTLDCEDGALIDQVTINIIPSYREI